MEKASFYRLPAPKDRPGWQLFLFGRLKEEPIPTGPAISSLNMKEEIDTAPNENTSGSHSEPELDSAEQQAMNIDDASTSDEEDAEPTNLAVRPASAATDSHPADPTSELIQDPVNEESKHPPEPSIALLRRFSQVSSCNISFNNMCAETSPSSLPSLNF